MAKEVNQIEGFNLFDTKAREEIQKFGSQLNKIANEDLIIKDGKIYIKQSNGTLKGTGVTLPTSSSGSGDISFEEVSSEECTIEETVNATAIL